MAKKTGILLDVNTSDLQINVVRGTDGKMLRGLTIGNTLYQNQFMIVSAYPGEIKQQPDIGVGINDIVLDNDVTKWKQRIATHLAKDGQKVKKIVIKRSLNFEIDADYS